VIAPDRTAEIRNFVVERRQRDDLVIAKEFHAVMKSSPMDSFG
jgi:hypothetical protein